MVNQLITPPVLATDDASDRATLTALLCRQYPRMYRIAAALTGSIERAESVANAVVARGLKQSNARTASIDRDRWSLHHTVLMAREIVRLNGYAGAAEAPLGPLHNELAKLPAQQREAFLLHHGELLDIRGLATAMDCSTTAAANHLTAAARRMRSSGEDLERITTTLPALIASIVPHDNRIRQSIEQQVVRATRRRRASIALRLFAMATALAALAWLVSFLWKGLVV